MAVQHREHAVFGVQFHPEAVLTEGGFELLGNFLRCADLPVPLELPCLASERPALPAAELDWSQLPLTF